MIITKLQGGHSNQLFQYAIGRQLAKNLDTDLVLDISWFDDFADIDTPRFYELGCYPIKATTRKTLDGLRIVDPRQPISKLQKARRKLNLGNDIWMYYEEGQGFHPEVLQQPGNTMLVGFWQTEKYFKDIRNELLKELEPIEPPSRKNEQIIKEIDATESVWMHVRRGDYVTNKHAHKFHGLKGADYYQNALAQLVKKLPEASAKNIAIFVSSNDIPWCKKNLDFPYPVTFIENELGSDDMRVAKHCKHDIIANSSFSWWGSWLNENPNKIVIAPKRWFEDEDANSTIDITLDSWIRI